MKTIVGKVVVLGHQGVGKTSLCTRYIEKNFSSHVSPTIGASYFTCKIKIEEIVVKLQIWDTAGQERFKAMAPMFYRNANAALLVFDISQAKTFESMKMWVLELKRNVEEAMVLCVIGNKTDITEARKVSRDEALHYAKSIGASYFECSAMSEQGVEQIFRNLSADIIRLCDENCIRTLKIYEGESESPLVASSTESTPTDIGTTEEPRRSVNGLAHATNVTKCC